jgi:hypothetical protein
MQNKIFDKSERKYSAFGMWRREPQNRYTGILNDEVKETVQMSFYLIFLSSVYPVPTKACCGGSEGSCSHLAERGL